MDKNFRSFDICGNIRRACARIRGVPQKKVGFAAVFKMASVFMDAIFYFRNFLMRGFLTFFARNIAFYFLQKKSRHSAGIS